MFAPALPHAPNVCLRSDLGAGDGSKTDILLRALQSKGADVEYAPVDISEGAMKTLTSRVNKVFPKVPLQGCVGDYLSALQWMNQNRNDRKHIVLFLGSNIGNFTPEQAIHFLASAHWFRPQKRHRRRAAGLSR